MTLLHYHTPNLLIGLAVAAILGGVLAEGVRRGYLHSDTVILLAAFVPSVICHEVSHGVMALWCGDDTAKRAGRLTLNPLKHIDPIGSIMVPLLFALSGLPAFGWAKPVPVSLGKLRHPRNQAVLVGLVGPLTNIVLAAIGGLVFHFALVYTVVNGVTYVSAPLPGQPLLAQIAFYFGIVNVILAVFNLIPIPPLDGSALVERLLPASVLPQYYRMRFGFMIVVLALVFFDQGLLQRLFTDVENWFVTLST